MDFFLRTKKDPNNSFHADVMTTYFFGQGSNDLQVGPNRDFLLTQSADFLGQAMAKILVTERGTNPLFEIYGSLLQDLIGQKLDIEYLRAKIKNELIDGLRIYQFINKDNPNLDEQIDTLDSIKISLINNYSLRVEFTVITKTGRRVGAIITIGES